MFDWLRRGLIGADRIKSMDAMIEAWDQLEPRLMSLAENVSIPTQRQTKLDVAAKKVESIKYARLKRSLDKLLEDTPIVEEVADAVGLPSELSVLINALKALPEDQQKALIKKGMELIPKGLNPKASDSY